MTETANAKAPAWYEEAEITSAIRRGSFFHKGKTIEESIALHLQGAFEKGFEMGRRVDPASENARLRKALLDRVMVWNDPSDRNYKLCDLCDAHEYEVHKAHCALA